MYKQFINKNISLVSIILFLIFFIIILIIKPQFIFDKNGKPREFGLGYKNKTIVPIWLVAIIIAILSYLAILYFKNINNFYF